MISSFSSLSKMGRSDINKYANAYTDALKNNPNDPSLNQSIGVCYIGLGVYDRALSYFEKIIDANPRESFGYFAAAISILGGKSAFIANKKDVDRAINYMNAALMIEESGLYHYFMAYLKYDYYKRKYLKVEPNFEYHLDNAKRSISDEDKASLFELLKTDIPIEIKI